jgi:hypothetical protein
MIQVAPAVLEGHGVSLEPLATSHARDIAEAVRDGELWRLWFTAVPEPGAGRCVCLHGTTKRGVTEPSATP